MVYIISQTKYLKYLLKRFGLESCNPIGTPMIAEQKLSTKDETPTVENKKYRSMIGGLQYLIYTRPNIVNVARFQVDSRQEHYAAIKKIFSYLKGTIEFGLWYERSNDFTLYAYINADWVGNMDEKKSTSGGSFFLVGILVSWLNKK